MTTILSCQRPINTSSEAEESSAHEVCPLVILTERAVERVAKYETSDWVPESVVSLSMDSDELISSLRRKR